MEKQKINIIVIILLLIFVCSITYVAFSPNDVIEVSGVKFKVPSGYHEGELKDKNLKVNLTDGSHMLYISVYNDTDVSKHIGEYINLVSNNSTIHISNFTTDDHIDIYRSFNEENNATHYWFIKNEKVYSVYNWGGKNTKIDSNFFCLIENI